ncbi:PDR/VanB family oxidoreductase [Microbacterium halophytorum]|uniref:PDR/VanB family oxidoreductase n=1 Tax=Microbacterium halophytorum TaxID=2067568 RepID=UPI000CFABEE0|nr:PDR/VanB family oxidoreductase [Microbacterium halophytorum]
MAQSHTVTWQGAVVLESIPLTEQIHRVVLRPDARTRIEPGMHVDVRLEVGGESATRSYSVVERVGDDGAFALSIMRTAVSRGGAAVMHALRPGDRVEVTHPLQDFPFRHGAPRYAFLAGGVGITAVLGMARAARRAGADYRAVYCGRSRAAMAYLDELGDEHGERLEVHVGDEGTSIDVPEFVAGIAPGTELYVCGPIRLMDAVRRAWDASEHPNANLRFETFGNSGWHEAQPFRVRVPNRGIDCVVPPDKTLLEALEESGADAMFDCRKGECGICEARVVSLAGDIDHRDVFYSERQKNARSKMCPCVSRIRAAEGGEMPVVELQLS